MSSNAKVQVAMASYCYEMGDLQQLDAVVHSLSKKRGILKQAVARMVQKCIEWVTLTTDIECKLKLIGTVRDVTEGKIYLEVERANVTRILAGIHESNGDVQGAARVMCDLQVETFGSMEKRDKVDFILEQMRLSIQVGEFQKATLMSRKVTSKTFESADFEDLKLRYLELMIKIAIHERRYLDCCKHNRSILQCKAISEDETKFVAVLKLAIIFAILSPYGNEQAELMNSLAREKKLERLPLYRELINTFRKKELIRWPAVEQAFGEELRTLPLLFGADEHSQTRWSDLGDRIVEHNLRTISGYYSTLSMNRLAELLNRTAAEAENILVRLATTGGISAKIDRIAGIITFASARGADEILNKWNTNVDLLLALMVKNTHQIAKEEMIHSSLFKGRA